MEPMIGELIGKAGDSQSSRYRIVALLGKQRGRRTFLANDCETGCSVVIKLVLFGADFTWEDLKLFEREAKTLKSLNHPQIPQYLDSFEVDTSLGNGFALVQAYIEAKSLQTWVEEGHTFDEEESKAIALSLLRILSYLHRCQPPVIHRDIKPSNILLSAAKDNEATGITYLVDFGSVQTVYSKGTITVVGTYGYMPPEQFGGRAGPASDLYSTGATLIYLVTGKHPAELTQQNLQIDFHDHHLSSSFSHWLRGLTYADLARRTRSASDALQQLAQAERVNNSTIGKLQISTNRSANILKSSFADFTVGVTSQKLVIQCLESRTNTREFVRDRWNLPDAKHEGLPGWAQISFAVAALPMFLSANPLANLMLKLGTKAPLNELLATVFCFLIGGITFVLTIPLILYFQDRLNQLRKPKMCQITLRRNDKHETFISLARIESKKDTGWLSVDPQGCSDPLFSSIKLHSSSLEHRAFHDRIRFTFSHDTLTKHSKLYIRGNRREIKWLCEHIKRCNFAEFPNRQIEHYLSQF